MPSSEGTQQAPTAIRGSPPVIGIPSICDIPRLRQSILGWHLCLLFIERLTGYCPRRHQRVAGGRPWSAPTTQCADRDVFPPTSGFAAIS